MAPAFDTMSFPNAHAFTERDIVSIEVGVGENQHTFELPKEVLCFYSGYFKAALKGRFVEAQNNMVRLPTEDPLMFELFAHWICTGLFYESTLSPSRLMDFAILTKLWVLGDAHCAPIFQNAVADVIVERVCVTKVSLVQHLPYVYDNTVAGSVLRDLAVDSIRYVHSGGGYNEILHTSEDVFPDEAMADLLTLCPIGANPNVMCRANVTCRLEDRDYYVRG